MLRMIMLIAAVPTNSAGHTEAISTVAFTPLEMKDDTCLTRLLNEALERLYALSPNARITEFSVSTPREGNT